MQVGKNFVNIISKWNYTIIVLVYMLYMNKFYRMYRFLYLALFLTFCSAMHGQAIAEENAEAAKAYEAEYAKNIKLTKINGVYIPGNLKEAFRRLSKLSPKASIANFKSAPEKKVCQSLHFGLGRWMIENWNFYTGSRLSHYLKGLGVLHPDDMAQFLLRTYHRHLNALPLDEEALVEELAQERKKVAEEVRGY